METLIALLVAALGTMFFFKKKADKAQIEKELIETRAKDQALKEQQELTEAAIAELDRGIEKMKTEKEASDKKRTEDGLSLAERRARLKKGLN